MSTEFWIKCLITFVGLCIFTWGSRNFQKRFDRFLHSRKCVKTDERTLTFGWLPVFFAGIAFVVIFLLFVSFFLIYEEMPLPEILLAPLGYGILAYVLAIPVQYIVLYYPKLYIQNHVLYMKGCFTEKAISFEELQKGRRLMKPFLHNDKCYLKLEQGSIFITPDMYLGGYDFLACLFTELGWEPILSSGESSDSSHALEEKALYEMLVKEQEMLVKDWEIRSKEQTTQNRSTKSEEKKLQKQPKPPGIWHNRG